MSNKHRHKIPSVGDFIIVAGVCQFTLEYRYMSPFLSPNVLKALKFASVAHQGQKRKDSLNSPYISHPAAVGLILSNGQYPEETIIAGILHDVIEDTKFGYDDIEKQFGKSVADIVQHCSEDKLLPYNEQKDKYIEHLEEAPIEALIVSGADLLANRVDMLINFETGDDLWMRPPFSVELPRKLERDKKRIEIIKRRANPNFIEELERVTAQVHQILIQGK